MRYNTAPVLPPIAACTRFVVAALLPAKVPAPTTASNSASLRLGLEASSRSAAMVFADAFRGSAITAAPAASITARPAGFMNDPPCGDALAPGAAGALATGTGDGVGLGATPVEGTPSTASTAASVSASIGNVRVMEPDMHTSVLLRAS